MPHKFNLRIETDSENSQVSGEFTDEESERLRLFVQYVDEVSKTKLVENGVWGKAKIQGEEGKVISCLADLPPWDDVIVFLHKSRPLLLENEATHFYKIQKLLGKALDHPVIREFLRAQRNLYSGKSFQEQVKFMSNGEILNSENVLFKWLNAYEYHREREYQEYIDSLHRMLPIDFSKVVFLGLLKDKATAAFGLADFIQVIQGVQQRVSLGG